MNAKALLSTAVAAFSLAILGWPPTSRAQEPGDQKQGGTAAKVEVLKETKGYENFLARATTAQPGFIAALLHPGTNTVIDSVPAGQPFDMLVLLNRTATSTTSIPVRAFRLDVSGLGSGDVKVLPIVDADTQYWAVSPPSPIEFPAGTRLARVSGITVRRDAKQPPAGSVVFPDQVVFFTGEEEFTLVDVLRIAQP